jgi:hypothetical protein
LLKLFLIYSILLRSLSLCSLSSSLASALATKCAVMLYCAYISVSSRTSEDPDTSIITSSYVIVPHARTASPPHAYCTLAVRVHGTRIPFDQYLTQYLAVQISSFNLCRCITNQRIYVRLNSVNESKLVTNIREADGRLGIRHVHYTGFPTPIRHAAPSQKRKFQAVSTPTSVIREIFITVPTSLCMWQKTR